MNSSIWPSGRRRLSRHPIRGRRRQTGDHQSLLEPGRARVECVGSVPEQVLACASGQVQVPARLPVPVQGRPHVLVTAVARGLEQQRVLVQQRAEVRR